MVESFQKQKALIEVNKVFKLTKKEYFSIQDTSATPQSTPANKDINMKQVDFNEYLGVTININKRIRINLTSLQVIQDR